MPKLPDPTLQIEGQTPQPEVSPSPIATVSPSPFRFVGPLLVALFVAGIGFAITRFLVLPRLKSTESVNLTYWGLWESSAVLESAITKFESDNPTIKVTYQMQSNVDYRQRLQSALARGEGPDIMRIHATWIPMFKDALDAAASSEFSTDEFRQAFFPVATTDLIRNTAVVAVPLMIDGLGLYVNNDLLSSNGATVPTTWNDLRKTAFALTTWDSKGQITQSGVAMGTTGNIAHWPDVVAALMLQNSVDLTKPDTTIDAKGRNLGADALRFYTIFTTDDRIWDDTLPPDTVAFAQGKVAMIIAPSWEAHALLAQNPTLNFSIYPIPQLSSQRQVTWASYWAEGVSKNSTQKEAAWKFLKFLSSKEALQLMYTEAAKTRSFGEIYPRADMAGAIQNSPYIGAFVQQASNAQSWYMSSATGDNGVNDEVIAYYADAINSITSQQKVAPETAIATAAKGIGQVLVKYGIITGVSVPPATQ